MRGSKVGLMVACVGLLWTLGASSVEAQYIPRHCGMSYPDYGAVTVGSYIVLGRHTPWAGDTWWSSAMESYVGRVARVTQLGGLDPVGCPYVRVDIDGGSWGWRIRNVTFLGGTGYGAGGYGSVIPTYCGMSYPDYGPLRIGSTVILGAHTEWNGDSWWNDAMWTYVGRTATITEFGGLDPAGCPYVRVNADGGSWGWRIRNLTLIR